MHVPSPVWPTTWSRRSFAFAALSLLLLTGCADSNSKYWSEYEAAHQSAFDQAYQEAYEPAQLSAFAAAEPSAYEERRTALVQTRRFSYSYGWLGVAGLAGLLIGYGAQFLAFSAARRTSYFDAAIDRYLVGASGASLQLGKRSTHD